jgi:acyl-CoA reductase-like NAD-dependent aldehyde dehydrogenase
MMGSRMSDDLVCISPVDGSEYARRPLHSDVELDVFITCARRAQRDWSRVPLAQRCGIVARFVDAMETLNPEIVPELAWQMGRPVRYGGEQRSLIERVNGMLSLAENAIADEVVKSDERIRRRISHEPVGLVLVIAPWNYPFLTAANTMRCSSSTPRKRWSPGSGSRKLSGWRACPTDCSRIFSSVTSRQHGYLRRESWAMPPLQGR